jgi:uncharacterized membrane protein/rubredoxin
MQHIKTGDLFMANLIRCKVCGYVAREGKIKDVCPACGAPAKMFEPYTDPVSEKRRRIMNLHIHPIMVHFPQAFVITLFLLTVLSYVIPPAIKETLFASIQVISFLLPYSAILALLTGLFDGKIRFRKLTTPFLKKKIIIGLLFINISIALAFLAFSGGLPASPIREYFTLLTIFAVACSAGLGLLGVKMLEAKFPG